MSAHFDDINNFTCPEFTGSQEYDVDELCRRLQRCTAKNRTLSAQNIKLADLLQERECEVLRLGQNLNGSEGRGKADALLSRNSELQSRILELENDVKSLRAEKQEQSLTIFALRSRLEAPRNLLAPSTPRSQTAIAVNTDTPDGSCRRDLEETRLVNDQLNKMVEGLVHRHYMSESILELSAAEGAARARLQSLESRDLAGCVASAHALLARRVPTPRARAGVASCGLQCDLISEKVQGFPNPRITCDAATQCTVTSAQQTIADAQLATSHSQAKRLEDELRGAKIIIADLQEELVRMNEAGCDGECIITTKVDPRDRNVHLTISPPPRRVDRPRHQHESANDEPRERGVYFTLASDSAEHCTTRSTHVLSVPYSPREALLGSEGKYRCIGNSSIAMTTSEFQEWSSRHSARRHAESYKHDDLSPQHSPLDDYYSLHSDRGKSPPLLSTRSSCSSVGSSVGASSPDDSPSRYSSISMREGASSSRLGRAGHGIRV